MVSYIIVLYFNDALIAKYVSSQIGLLIIAIISFIVGYTMSYYKVPQYLFINTSITSLFFYLLGNVFSAKIKSLCIMNKYVAIICGSILLIISQLIYDFNNCYIFYRNNELEANIVSVVFVALIGIIGILFISVFLSHMKLASKILTYFGENSLIILCTHLYCLKVIQLFHLPNGIQFILVTICMVPIIYFLKKFLPRLSGIQPLFV